MNWKKKVYSPKENMELNTWNVSAPVKQEQIQTENTWSISSTCSWWGGMKVKLVNHQNCDLIIILINCAVQHNSFLVSKTGFSARQQMSYNLWIWSAVQIQVFWESVAFSVIAVLQLQIIHEVRAVVQSSRHFCNKLMNLKVEIRSWAFEISVGFGMAT